MIWQYKLADCYSGRQPQYCAHALLKAFSSQSAKPVRQGFPAIFEGVVGDLQLRPVASCCLVYIGGSLH